MRSLVNSLAAVVSIGMLVLIGAGTGMAADEKPAAEAAAIAAEAAVASDHPPIEEGFSCNDCHEITLDAGSAATQVWLTGDYLKWSAGEGIMPQEQVFEEIVKIFKGKDMKRTFVMATVCNNRPYTYTADFALDPEKKVLYAFHEKKTEKLFHIAKNPYVSMNYHREFDDDFANVLCFQVLGKAELFDGTTKEFEEGLNVYPYEYAAKARNLSIEAWREIVKKDMIMTRTTIDRIRLTSGALARSQYRTSQEWKRPAGK